MELTGTIQTAAPTPPAPRKLTFTGSGGDFFGIVIVNYIFTIFTLGLYYPWAKAATLRYLYGSTVMDDSNFQFHGTGKEMFIGFIKAIGILLGVYLFFVWAITTNNPVWAVVGMLVFYGVILALIPFAIHGRMRYRLSRSSWRGIHFGYRGSLKELMSIYWRDILITLFTFGIYYSWFAVNLRQYVVDRCRFGNIEFRFRGDGSDLFVINLKGIFLTYITLGIYGFWYAKNLYNYYINNMAAIQGDKELAFSSRISAGDVFALVVPNVLLTLITFGLATPWVIIRELEFMFTHMEIPGELDMNALVQTEEDYRDATAEDLSDMLDIGLV